MSDEECLALEPGYKNESNYRLRVRCRAILLKSRNLYNAEVSRKLYVAVPSVFNWTKRYTTEGIAGLKTKPGQGRKLIMDCTDESLVRETVSQERQSVKATENLWEESSGKIASDITSKRFLEVLVQDISVYQTLKGNTLAAIQCDQTREVVRTRNT